MKVAILGDTHFGVHSDSAVFHKYFEDFYKNVFFPYLEEHSINTVFQLGDMFDKKKQINFYSLSRSREYFFNPAQRKGIEIVCNVGNHDAFFKHSLSINAPDLLTQEYDNVFIIDSPTERIVDGVKFLILPWICRDNEKETMDLIESTKAQIALGHLELAGFSMYRGTISEHGMNHKIFDKFDMVLSGHYHTKSSYDNIHYVGTPYEITWSDWDDPRGFHVLDTDTRELTFVRNSYEMFKKIPYDDEGKTLEEVLDFPFDAYTDKFVKVIALKKTSQNSLDMFVKALENAGALDVKTTDNSLILELNTDVVEDVEDTLTIIRNSVDEIETTVSKEKLVKLFETLYVEAKQMEIA